MSVRILQSRTFARWARSEGLADSDLCRAAREIENGLVAAKLDNVEDNKRKALIKLGNQYMDCNDKKRADLIKGRVLSEVTGDD